MNFFNNRYKQNETHAPNFVLKVLFSIYIPPSYCRSRYDKIAIIRRFFLYILNTVTVKNCKYKKNV